MTDLYALLFLAVGGAATALAASTVTDPSNLAPYVGGGAGVIAVTALAEVLRRLLNGRLIPRETKDFEEELTREIAASGQREAQTMAYAERAVRALEDCEDQLRALRRAVEKEP